MFIYQWIIESITLTEQFDVLVRDAFWRLVENESNSILVKNYFRAQCILFFCSTICWIAVHLLTA